MSSPSEQEVQLIKEELKRTSDLRKIARHLGVPVSWVRDVEVSRFKSGRDDLRKYIVASKHVDREWNNRSPEIRKAREAYDRGEVEMCQGRDGYTIHLYAIPRKVRDERENRAYFSREVEG